ncbi:MAG: hydantoinase B/oxoprolinase family protein, partial [Roseiflexus sp.]
EVEFRAPVTVSLLTERRVYAPYGLYGGAPGLRGRNILLRDGEDRILPGKITIDLRPGDILRIETPGGGGFGAQEQG